MFYPVLNLILYIVMITFNALSMWANPIGGRSTAELSDSFPSLFTPAGFTFSIWGIIYLFLAFVVIIPFVNIIQGKSGNNQYLTKQVSWFFALTCILNATWVVVWQYQYVTLSIIVMLAFLVTLIALYLRLRRTGVTLTFADRYITRPAFSLYLGWISVATIANFCIYFLYIWADSWGLDAHIVTIVLIVVAVLLGAFILLRFNDRVFPLVIIWALYGIMSKRMAINPTEFADIIMTTQIGMGFLVGLITATFFITSKKLMKIIA